MCKKTMPLQRICFAVAALMFTATTAMAGSPGKPKQAMFKTQAEAEAAAPGFGCAGAHQKLDQLNGHQFLFASQRVQQDLNLAVMDQ